MFSKFLVDFEIFGLRGFAHPGNREHRGPSCRECSPCDDEEDETSGAQAKLSTGGCKEDLKARLTNAGDLARYAVGVAGPGGQEWWRGAPCEEAAAVEGEFDECS